jgi:hypothetical protein
MKWSVCVKKCRAMKIGGLDEEVENVISGKEDRRGD